MVAFLEHIFNPCPLDLLFPDFPYCEILSSILLLLEGLLIEPAHYYDVAGVCILPDPRLRESGWQKFGFFYSKDIALANLLPTASLVIGKGHRSTRGEKPLHKVKVRKRCT